MCRLHSRYRFDIDFRPQGQIYRFLLCFRVRPLTSVCFDIGIPFWAHGSITMRTCIAYIYDPVTTLTIDLKVKFIGFMTWLCVQASAFLSFDKVILCLARGCITMVRCFAYIHELYMTLTFDLNINILFSHEFESGKNIFARWHRRTKFWHMRLSPSDYMLCKEVNVTRSEFSKPSSVSKTNTVLEFDFDLDFA